MNKTRLEAFSDGVFAIIITIMVLELKVPHDTTWHALWDLRNVFLSYVMSFIFVAIYWGNHHHLIHTVHHVNSKIIWANMGFLFPLSLAPFVTAWMGENNFDKIPVAIYCVDLLMCAIGYTILHETIKSHYTHSTKLTEALIRQRKKAIISLILYISALVSSFYNPWISVTCIIATSILWIVPDKNIERAMKDEVIQNTRN
jgi:uncharacterized membrane protein